MNSYLIHMNQNEEYRHKIQKIIGGISLAHKRREPNTEGIDNLNIRVTLNIKELVLHEWTPSVEIRGFKGYHFYLNHP